MFMRVSRSGLAWLTAAIVVLTLAVPGQSQDKAPRPPSSGGTSGTRTDLEKARADVCTALEQLRLAEAKLRDAEKRLRELEGKTEPGGREPQGRDGAGEAHIYRLKNTTAVEMAKVLQEVFGKGRMMIVADPASNSLIVRGNLEDILTVAALLEKLDIASDQPKKPERKR